MSKSKARFIFAMTRKRTFRGTKKEQKTLQLFVCSKIFLYVCDIETIKECWLCLEWILVLEYFSEY